MPFRVSCKGGVLVLELVVIVVEIGTRFGAKSKLYIDVRNERY